MLVHAGCWHRPRTDGFVFFKPEDTGGGPGLVEKGAVASWASLPQGGGRREESPRTPLHPREEGGGGGLDHHR